ncbi:MAG TPA: DUF3365 domain-containing protein [Vicinamibacterales bacterium]|nr:DUF3365 domain-containing protein [Vicinamibacterales bacterium]
MIPVGPLLAAVLAAGMTASEWTAYPVAQAPAELRPAMQRGDLVIVALQSAVLRELTAAMAEGGPEHALLSCHLDAVAVSRAVSRREGVEAGRTSARLRNIRNAPRPWAAAIVARYDGKDPRDAGGFVVDLGDRVGLVRPIVEQPICAACHGPVEKISPAVKAALEARYPADRAVGFDNGDLRGWFWVEVPKQPRAR